MKFTKEQLTEALKAKLTENGKKIAISDRTLQNNVGRIYARLEKSNDESELADTVAEYLPDFEELEGNYRKDNADFIKEWEKNHPTPKPEPNPAPKDDKDKLDILMEQIEEMRKERAAEKAERTAAEKRGELIAKFKEKGIKDDKWVEAYVKKLQISDKTDVEAETTDALALFNKGKATVYPNGGPAPSGGGDTENKEQFADIVANIKRKRHEA